MLHQILIIMNRDIGLLWEDLFFPLVSVARAHVAGKRHVLFEKFFVTQNVEGQGYLPHAAPQLETLNEFLETQTTAQQWVQMMAERDENNASVTVAIRPDRNG